MRYRICGNCGAALDPGERCDCQQVEESQTLGKKRKKKAAPVRQHRNGKVETVTNHNSTSILQNSQEDCQV